MLFFENSNKEDVVFFAISLIKVVMFFSCFFHNSLELCSRSNLIFGCLTFDFKNLLRVNELSEESWIIIEFFVCFLAQRCSFFPISFIKVVMFFFVCFP